MGEEKRLDKKALEEASGGAYNSESGPFMLANCSSCGHSYNRTCPYRSKTDAMADAGAGGKCSKKVP